MDAGNPVSRTHLRGFPDQPTPFHAGSCRAEQQVRILSEHCHNVINLDRISLSLSCKITDTDSTSIRRQPTSQKICM